MMQVASLESQNVPSKYSEDYVNSQAELNLRWAHMSEGSFSDVAALLFLLLLLLLLFLK